MKDWKQLVEDQGYQFEEITSSPGGAKSIHYICDQHHKTKTLVSRWNLGVRCAPCKKLLQDDSLRSQLTAEGYTLQSISQTNSGRRLITTCPNQHHYEAQLSNWNQGYRCKECQSTSWTIDLIHTAFAHINYKCLSTTYTKTADYIAFECDQGHKHKIRLNAFLRGQRCGICRLKPLVQTEVISELAEVGLELTNTIQYHTDKMNLKCTTCSYLWEGLTFHRWQKLTARSCKKCRGIAPWTHQEVKAFLEKANYTLLSTEYVNAHSHLDATCPEDHPYRFMFTLFLQGYRCGKCFSISGPEQELNERFASFSPHRDRTILKPKELDLFFKDQGLAIEYCGLYWHSSLQERMIPSYHADKTKACRAQGIRLITIFEDEWLDSKEKCLAEISRALGDVENHVTTYTTRQLRATVGKQFVQQYGLAESKGKVFYGVLNRNKIVQVLAGREDGDQFTITNMVFHPEYSTRAGTSDLINICKAKYRELIAKCDLRWDIPELYEALGFELIEEIGPQPKLVDQTRRLPFEESSNLPRIYDCGHEVWRLKTY